MDGSPEVLVAFRQSDAPCPGAISVSDNFHHSSGSISIAGSTAKKAGGAELLWGPRVAGCLWGLQPPLVLILQRQRDNMCLTCHHSIHTGTDVFFFPSVSRMIWKWMSEPMHGIGFVFSNIYIRRCNLRQETLCSVRWKPCRDELVSARRRRCHVWTLGSQCLRGNSSHVAIVFYPQGGLYVVEHMVFTNAMATFSQCGLANFQPALSCGSELGKSRGVTSYEHVVLWSQAPVEPMIC